MQVNKTVLGPDELPALVVRASRRALNYGWTYQYSIQAQGYENEGAVSYFTSKNGDTMIVAVSEDHDANGRIWLHISVSRPDRNPSWEDLKKAKMAFMGDVDAFQWLPRQKDYVNLHPYCFHLWHCSNDDSFRPPEPASEATPPSSPLT